MALRFSAVLLAAVAGCASAPRSEDRIILTDLHRDRSDTSGRTFLYTAAAPMGYAATSDQAENVRMEWLATWMSINKLCPRGYRVVTRDSMLASERTGYARITYLVRCSD